MLSWLFPKTTKVRCGDGSEKIVYKNVDDAFPLFIPGWKGDFSAELKAMEALPAKAKASYSAKIQGLLFQLNDANSSLMMNFRSAYIVFQSDPCGSSEFLKRQVEKLIDQQHRLAELRVQIQAILELAKRQPTDNEKILQILNAAVNGLQGRVVGDVAALEVAENRVTALKWIKGENDGQ